MPRDDVGPPRGRVRLHRVRPFWGPGWVRVTDWMHNDFLFEWGTVVGQLLLRQGSNYGVGGMYLEFENVAAPEDPADVPAFSRNADQGVTYYNALSSSPDQDYLRVPLIAGTLASTDSTKFPRGNAPTFFCQTTGVAGVHGKPFSDAHNSKVFGGALVAFVDPTDATRDLVLSRFYAGPSDQLVKLPSGQIGVEWQVRFG